MQSILVEVFEDAKALISIPSRWAKGSSARDIDGNPVEYDASTAHSFCMLGALQTTCHKHDGNSGEDPLYRRAYEILREHVNGSVAVFNDASFTTHADVMDVLDQTISSVRRAYLEEVYQTNKRTEQMYQTNKQTEQTTHPTLDTTLAFIKIAHHGQTDMGGVAYWKHPLAVMNRLPEDASEDMKHAALLHDVLEDTAFSERDLIDFGYSIGVVDIVRALTRNSEMSYTEYISNLARSGFTEAILVKIADVEHNSCPERLSRIKRDQTKYLKRYALAHRVLVGAIETENGIRKGDVVKYLGLRHTTTDSIGESVADRLKELSVDKEYVVRDVDTRPFGVYGASLLYLEDVGNAHYNTIFGRIEIGYRADNFIKKENKLDRK